MVARSTIRSRENRTFNIIPTHFAVTNDIDCHMGMMKSSFISSNQVRFNLRIRTRYHKGFNRNDSFSIQISFTKKNHSFGGVSFIIGLFINIDAFVVNIASPKKRQTNYES